MARHSPELAARRWEISPIVASDQLRAPAKPSWRGSGGHFVEKTVADVAVALEQVLFAEQYAARPGFLQRIDPRIKLISVAILLLCVSLATRISTLIALHVLTLALAALSAIPLRLYLKRVWLFIPLFAGIMAVPAVFNFITPGYEVAVLADWGTAPTYGPIALPARIAITEPGLIGFALLMLRVATSVSLAVLLMLTTKWWMLLKALRALRVPQVAILILAMTYRYIYTVLRTVQQAFQARKSRTVGHISGAENRRWVAASVGTLVAKSYVASNEVYLAMLSRGFGGEVRLVDTFRLRAADVLWLVVSATLGGALVLSERALIGWVV